MRIYLHILSLSAHPLLFAAGALFLLAEHATWTEVFAGRLRKERLGLGSAKRNR